MSEMQREDGTEAGFVRYGDGLRGYLARPADGGPYPGVILIQEWWGIDQHIEELTRRLAAEGFVVLAPDLYHGTVAQTPEHASEQARSLNPQQAVGEISEAINDLQRRDDDQPKKVGVVGFCMGGRYAWSTAMADAQKVGAVAPFYAGGFNPSPEELQRVTAPILIVWGSRDPSTPQEQRDRIVRMLEEEGKTFKTLVFPADHAFMNDRRSAYDERAAGLAYRELVSWFKRYLS